MHQVFISYSSKNKGIADAICLHLESNGIRCWYAPRDILPGKDWVESIMDAIEEAKVFLLIYSSDSNQSRQVQNEVAAAFNAGCAIVPFRIDDTKMVSKMAYFLNSVHWLDAAHSPPSATFRELTGYIPQFLGEQPAKATDPAASISDLQPKEATRARLSPTDALKKILSTAPSDSNICFEMKLSADPKQVDQQVRGTAHFPHGNGTRPRILVLTKVPSKITEAIAAGADYAGGEELTNKIAHENWRDFDVIIASPEFMGTVGRIARFLPSALLPSPKLGTLTPAVGAAVKQIRSGKIIFRMDSKGIIRCNIGKSYFGLSKLTDNLETLVSSIEKEKPSSLPGKLILSASVSADSEDSVSVDVSRYI